MLVRDLTIGTVAALCVVATLGACGESAAGEHRVSSSYEIADALTGLRVDGYGGDIAIRVGDGPVKVTETKEYRDTEPVSRHSVSGGELLLRTDRCAVDGVCNVDYEITVPAALAVTLTSRGGRVEVSGLAGATEVDSGGGKVVAGRLSAPRLTVSSGGGEVEVAMSAPPESVSVRTGGGGAELSLPGGPFRVTADSGGGAKKVEVETAASGPAVDVATGGGEIVIKAA